MEKFSEANSVLMNMKSLIVYIAALPLLIAFCILIFWIVSTCVYLNSTYKHLKRLRVNATDSYTQKLLHNAKFNFYKFIFILVLTLAELCVCIYPLINHLAFDNVPFKDKNKKICSEDCCLENRTFLYNIERLDGSRKYLSLFLDAASFATLLTIFWIFTSLLQYSQLAFIEKKCVKRRLITKLKCTTVINTAISAGLCVLMGIPETLLLGYSAYTVLSWCYLYFIITHYLRLRMLKRRHLVDLMYECYDDKIKIRREQHDLKWTQRGSEFVISTFIIILLVNSLEMILVRTLLPILINPCWLSLQYSIHLNFQLPKLVSEYLILIEHFVILLRYFTILMLFVTVVVNHIVYIVDKVKMSLKNRKLRNSRRIKMLVDDAYVSWNSK